MECRLQDIADALLGAEHILLFPHIQIDGDALGSAVALCIAMRQLNKSCHILVEEDIPEYLAFLDQGYCIREAEITPDVSVAVDCGDVSRIEGRKEVFYSAKKTLCIDHHLLHADFADHCYVDSEAAATGILMFRLFQLLQSEGLIITPDMANAVFVAILTDTGSFCYSNADQRTHRIVADLYDYGLDHSPLCDAIHDHIPLQQLLIEGKALESVQLYADGRICLSVLSLKTMGEYGVTPNQTGRVIDRLRSIQGVDIAIFLREKPDGTYKASFRSKSNADVGSIAHRLGGGGHRKAAGCTIHVPLPEAVRLVVDAAKAELV